MSTSDGHGNATHVECVIDGKTVRIETGRIAKQSNGSVLVTSGKGAVLVTVNSAKPRPGIDFFPLTVDFVEKSYAAGKIPGGFFKREGQLSDKGILTSRFIDRALRPLFPDGYRDETQVTADGVVGGSRLTTSTCSALSAPRPPFRSSDIPFPSPIAAVRVSRVDGKLMANATHEQVASGRYQSDRGRALRGTGHGRGWRVGGQGARDRRGSALRARPDQDPDPGAGRPEESRRARPSARRLAPSAMRRWSSALRTRL